MYVMMMMRERHHGLKSWDEHGTKGAGQAANATSRKYKNERHHTYAMFLYRDARQVRLLTGESNVTKKVHESVVTSCTVQRRGNWAQKPHFSEAANTK